MTDITKIQHARELKALGLPTNIPVEDREYSRKGSILQLSVWKHYEKIQTYRGRELTEKENLQCWRTLAKLRHAAQRLDKYIGQLRRRGDLEAMAHSAFLVQKIIPLFEEIDEAIASQH